GIPEKAPGPRIPTRRRAPTNSPGFFKPKGALRRLPRPSCPRRASYERALGLEHPAAALSLNQLAFLLQAQGDFAGAQPLCERALAIREKALGPEHPATARSLNNLASLLKARGDLAGARRLHERAL